MKYLLIICTFAALGLTQLQAQSLAQLKKAFTALGYEPALKYVSIYESDIYKKWADTTSLDRLGFLLAIDEKATDSLAKMARARMASFYTELEAKKIGEKSLRQQISLIRRLMRKRFLNSYHPAATPLEAFTQGLYSNFTACGLYALVFDHYGIPYQIWADAIQALVVADPFGQYGGPIEIEEGGEFLQAGVNSQAQLHYLSFLVKAGVLKQEKVQSSKFDELFYKYYLPMEDLFFHELLGMLYLQSGMMYMRRRKPVQAAWQLEKAFLFRPSYAVKYRLYLARVQALQAATFGNWEEVQNLISAYQLLPGEEMQQLVLQAFVSMGRTYLHKKDSTAYYDQLFQALTTQLADSQLHKQLGLVYYQEKAQKEAQAGQYPAAIAWLKQVDSSLWQEDFKTRLAHYTGAYLATLTSCTDRLLFIQDQLDSFPFLHQRTDLMNILLNCQLEEATAHFRQGRPALGASLLAEFEKTYQAAEGSMLNEPQLEQAYLAAAQHYRQAGMPAKAKTYVEKGLKFLPQSAALLNFR
ncbi:MAG: hypothetical protein D6730_11285 [Bacteroidetes bacterium]|nr:MAG: hypothetical protein D6730_11285 [Bacteroidota bacterium]